MAAKWQSRSSVYKRYLRGISDLYETREDFRVFIEVLLSLSAIGVFGAFAIRPTLVTIAGLFSEIKDKRETSEILDQKIQNLNDAQEITSQYRQEIDRLRVAVAAQPDPVGVIRQIEGLAQKHGVLVSSLNIGAVSLIGERVVTNNVNLNTSTEDIVAFPSAAGEIPVSAIFTGEYQALAAMLSDLELMLRPFFEDKVVIANDTIGGVSLSLNVSGRVPYLLQSE